MNTSASTPRRPISIAVTSGKGGVGKTSVAVNLAVALARLRHRVVILDADFGLGNVDVLMGLAPFVALVCFFVFKSWLWFLLIPAAGVILYSGDDRRKRRRNDTG